MVDLIEDKFIGALKGLAGSLAVPLNDEDIELISENVIDLFSQHLNGLTSSDGLPSDFEGFESQLTGSKIPAWIQPLHFEKNLNLALDAVQATEALLAEFRQFNLIKIQQNYFKSILTGSDAADVHESLSTNLDLDKLEENIQVRIAKKIVDLVEYTKAAKVGARVLFEIPYENMEANIELGSLTKIRESLRLLTEHYRVLSAKDIERTVVVSLKHARKRNGHYLVEEWSGVKDRRTDPDLHRAGFENVPCYDRHLNTWYFRQNRSRSSSLIHDQIEFDLAEFSGIPIKNSRGESVFPRILKVGIQILDLTSMKTPPNKPNIESLHHSNYWQLNLEPTDLREGMHLGEVDGRSYRIPTLDFTVAASSDPRAIVWSRSGEWLNFDPLRSWTLRISKQAHTGSALADIRDVLVHFHLAHQSYSSMR